MEIARPGIHSALPHRLPDLKLGRIFPLTVAALKHTYRTHSGGRITHVVWPPSIFGGNIMLIAYLDEFGHQGPYISHDHSKYNAHPCFGYAGFVLSADKVRNLGGYFKYVKEKLLLGKLHALPSLQSNGRRKDPLFSPQQISPSMAMRFCPHYEESIEKWEALMGRSFTTGSRNPLDR